MVIAVNASTLFKFLVCHTIDLNYCQEYLCDNVGNMSSKVKEYRFLQENKLHYLFVPCCAYSLNLVGKMVAITCFIDFCATLCVSHNLFNMLGGYQPKWVLGGHMTVFNIHCACQSDDNVNTICKYSKIEQALDGILSDQEQNTLIQNLNLYGKIKKLGFAVLK